MKCLAAIVLLATCAGLAANDGGPIDLGEVTPVVPDAGRPPTRWICIPYPTDHDCRDSPYSDCEI